MRNRFSSLMLLLLLSASPALLLAVDTPSFSHTRGHYSSSFELTITAPIGSVVRYTTDSAWPDGSSQGGSNSVSFAITTTTVVKAVSIAGAEASTTVAHTFVFPSDVLNQPARAKGSPAPPPDGLEAPSGWGSTKMQSGATVASLEALPVLSVAVPMHELFDETDGIMPNSPAEHRKVAVDPLGNDWERRASAEMFTAAGETIFEVGCGLRIAGATAASKEKTPFALEFRSRYGPGMLEADLMQTGHIRQFDELRLDNQLEDPRSSMAQPLAVTLQQEASGLAPNTRRTHVYLNGIYWGIYNLINRSNEGNASAWMGRDKDHIAYNRNPSKGDASIWRTPMMFFDTVDDEADYDFFRLVNEPSHYADYMILALVTDADGQTWNEGMFVKNEQTGEGHRGYFWDYHGRFKYGGTGDTAASVTPGVDAGDEPRLLYLDNALGFSRVRAHPAFRRLLEDHIHRHFFNDGMLTAARAAEIVGKAAQGLAAAYPAEYARWTGRSPLGDGNAIDQGPKIVSAYTDWLPKRAALVLQFLRDEGLYPATDTAPTFAPFGGTHTGSTTVTIARPADGTIWYTTDGSDPSTSSGNRVQVTASSTNITLDESTHLQARVVDGGVWSPLTEAAFAIDEQRDGLVVSEIHYHPSFTNADRVHGLQGIYKDGTYYSRGRIDEVIDFDWGADGVYPGFASDDQAALWTGWLTATDTGTHRLRLVYNGRVTLAVDGDELVTTLAGSDADTSATVDVFLEAGEPTKIEIGYYPVETDARCELQWREPAAGSYVPVPRNALRYELTGPEDYAFIELHNSGATGIDLTDWSFRRGIRYSFKYARVLRADERLILVANPRAFGRRYPMVTYEGAYAGALSDDGDRLQLVDADADPVIDFTYNDSGAWPAAADGAGSSLLYTGTDPNDPASWQASQDVGGNPGGPDTPATGAGILVNEVLAHTDPPDYDSIELSNPTGSSVDVSGWYLTDDRQNPAKWQIPGGTSIAAGGYLVFDENDFGSAFQLSSQGDGAYVFAADSGGTLTGYSHGFPFPASFNGVSFGRHVISTGEEHFVAQISETLGAVNSGPRVGPVVISELQYHPAGSEVEFVEFYNTSASAVSLYDAEHSNPWRLSGAGWSWSDGDQIAAGGVALLVKDDPASFRSQHGVAASVPIFGPFTAKLDNGGETLRLLQPDEPGVDGLGNPIQPEVPVEILQYDDEDPWPVEPDGSGTSLQRLSLTSYGNDVANWQSATPTPGQVAAEDRQRTIAIDSSRRSGVEATLDNGPPRSLPATFEDVTPQVDHEVGFTEDL